MWCKNHCRTLDVYALEFQISALTNHPYEINSLIELQDLKIAFIQNKVRWICSGMVWTVSCCKHTSTIVIEYTKYKLNTQILS